MQIESYKRENQTGSVMKDFDKEDDDQKKEKPQKKVK